MATTDSAETVDAIPSVDRLDRASAPALHRLRDLRVFAADVEVVDDVIDYVIARPRHRKGLGPATVRDLLRLDGGRFCLRCDGDSTVVYVRWVREADGDDTFLVKKVWTDAWPASKSEGEVEYELKGRDSVGHHLDHTVCAYRDKKILLRENHFDEPMPEEVRP